MANMQARFAEHDKDFIALPTPSSPDSDKVTAWVERTIEAPLKLSEPEMCGKIAERLEVVPLSETAG